MAKIDVLKEPVDGHISSKPELVFMFDTKAAKLSFSPEEGSEV